MSSEREAVERLASAANEFDWREGDTVVVHALDLRLILTDYARLQSESAKDGEAVAWLWTSQIGKPPQLAFRPPYDTPTMRRRWTSEPLFARLSARKATPPAGSTQIGEG